MTPYETAGDIGNVYLTAFLAFRLYRSSLHLSILSTLVLIESPRLIKSFKMKFIALLALFASAQCAFIPAGNTALESGSNLEKRASCNVCV